MELNLELSPQKTARVKCLKFSQLQGLIQREEILKFWENIFGYFPRPSPELFNVISP